MSVDKLTERHASYIKVLGYPGRALRYTEKVQAQPTIAQGVIRAEVGQSIKGDKTRNRLTRWNSQLLNDGVITSAAFEENRRVIST